MNDRRSATDVSQAINHVTLPIEALLSALPGMVYQRQPDQFPFLSVSDGCEALTGYTRDALLNESFTYKELIHPDDLERVLAEIDEAKVEKRPFRNIYRLIKKDHTVRWVLERGRSIDHLTGCLLIGFMTDHTDRMESLQGKEKQIAIMEERNRLARELHDSVTQSLYSLTLFAEAGRQLNQQGAYEQASSLFDDVLTTGQQALREMRMLVHKLRPSQLEKEGLVKAIQHRLKAVEGRAGMKHRFDVEGIQNLDADIEDALYFVVQEALNNTLKHAQANAVHITMRQTAEGTLHLTISDDGAGYDLESGLADGGLGLATMRERVEVLGGTISYRSKPGIGTTVTAQIPTN